MSARLFVTIDRGMRSDWWPRRVAQPLAFLVAVARTILAFVLVSLGVAGVVGTASACATGAGYAYDAPVHVYDGATHSAHAHTSEDQPPIAGSVPEGTRGTVLDGTGPFSVLLPFSVAANTGLATSTNEAVFWSGIRGGDQAATSWAARNGGMTLETTMAQRGVALPVWDASNPAVVSALRQASAEFAQGARGNVTVLEGDAVRINSVWAQVEYPALTANPNVTSITAVNPATGSSTVLWTGP